MQESDKIAMVKSMANETDESTVSAYLGIAASKICRRAYPFDPTVSDVPEQYGFLQVEIAVYLLNKRGGEGELSHSENGISRSYENGDVPESMMRQVVPMAGVL